MSQRRGGIIQVQVNGVVYDAKGDFTYNPGSPKREALIGRDGVHGFTETVQAPFIEGEFTDSVNLDLKALTKTESATVTLALANGKTFVLRDAWYAADGDVNTGEGNIQVRFEGVQGEEVG